VRFVARPTVRSAAALAIATALATSARPAPARADAAVDVHALNQIEYTLRRDSDEAAAKPRESLEEWLDLDVHFRRALIGFRYEAFQPPKTKPDSVREGIVQRYAEFGWERATLRVGNYYEIFGRGLLFRSYEERSVRVDGNMDGALVTGKIAGFAGKALTGRIREVEVDEIGRSDVLHGLDIERRVARGTTIGVSALSLASRLDDLPGAGGSTRSQHEEALGARASFSRDRFDAYLEGGRIGRFHRTSLEAANGVAYGDLRGTGVYGALNLVPIDRVAVTVEYKDYERFRFRPIGAAATATNYNNPPAVTRETGYTLLSRHPHVLDPNNEKGFQAEAVITPSPGSTITLNRSETDRQDGTLYFHEWYGEYRRPLGERWEAAAVYDFIEDAVTQTENHTPAVEVEYHPPGERSVRGELQHQRTKTQGLGDSRSTFALAELRANLDLSISVIGEHASFPDPVTRETDSDNFVYAEVSYHVTPEHFLSITAGKRRAGYICVGGICRLEPELNGAEVRFVTSF